MFWILLAYGILPLTTYPVAEHGHILESADSAAGKEVAESILVDENRLGCTYQKRVRDLMESEIGIFEQPPENFNHTIQVSACIIQAKDRILALQRGFHKYDPGKWEVPGGKFLKGETLNVCASRELFEETGIEHHSFQEMGVLYVRRKEGDFTLRVIFTEFQESPEVKISKEHHSYRWVTADEMRHLDLIKGEERLIDMYVKSFRKIISSAVEN